MIDYQIVPLEKAYLLLNHGPTVLISCAYGDERNVIAAGWCTVLDYTPARVLVILDKQGYSHQLIKKSGEFVMMLPSKAMAKLVLQVGACTGSAVDKFAAFDIPILPAKTVVAPLINGCLAFLECKLIDEPHNQDTYDLYIGEVTCAWADPRVFSNGRWHIKDESLRSIHYQAGGQFFAIEDSFQVEE